MNSEYIRLFATIPMLIGAVIMVLTIRKYHSFVKYFIEETYEKRHSGNATEKAALTLLYLFLAGFVVGIADTLIRGVEPMYFFIAIIFLLGALFVFFSVRTQMAMAKRLREKTLETMKAFVNAIDMKDAYTKGHSEHVYRLVDLLYESLDSRAKNLINKAKLLDAAMLHDIGKISIKDEILNKTGKLDNHEWEEIKTHPFNGKKMLEDSCYKEIGDWVLYHHERMDGHGYYGLEAKKIPIESKLIAIADTYSALCTDRVYRKKMTHEQAAEIMMEAAGTQLDSSLVKIFLSIDKESLLRILS
ncbi:HD domain-containing protein [Christensenellaceae bacterium OttesenSCG-928-K19]|nr:HD domain-containing protein [Christensenellaceae bacterium OttesenSCG-928-K19]